MALIPLASSALGEATFTDSSDSLAAELAMEISDSVAELFCRLPTHVGDETEAVR